MFVMSKAGEYQRLVAGGWELLIDCLLQAGASLMADKAGQGDDTYQQQ